MRSSPRWLRLALLVPLLVLLMGQEKCPPPDYSAPDNSGPLPPGTAAATKQYEEKMIPDPVLPLVCDRIEYETINVSQQNVNCNPFNYSTLFQQAKALADGVAAATSCPDNCKPLHTWIERVTTDCQDRTAGVVLEVGLLCPRNAQRPPGVLVNANDPRLNGAPITIGPQPPAGRTYLGEVKGLLSAGPVTCRPVEAVEYVYREQVDCTKAGFSFRRFDRRARQRAGMVCKAIDCAQNCKRCEPPVIMQSAWTCNNPGAPDPPEVEVRVQVQCCKP